MPNLRDLVRAANADLPVTIRMERWMLANADPKYSESAIQFSDDFLRGYVGGNRKNRKVHFRASGFGKCARKRVFERIGHPGISEQFSSSQANIFATGNFLHRKWQMAGLTEGWLVAAEVPLESDDLDLGGTADGVIYDNSLFEFKTINSRGWKFITSRDEPDPHHVLQVAAYKLLNPSLVAASIIYENKDTGEWREYRVQYTDEVLQPMEEELASLRKSVEKKELPPIKPGCLAKEGMEYRRCPFRESCLKIKIWPQEK